MGMLGSKGGLHKEQFVFIRESNKVVKALNDSLDLFTVRLRPKNARIALFFKIFLAPLKLPGERDVSAT